MARTLVIFDVDGTLTDSTQVDAQCYLAALQEALGLRLESTDWSRFVDCTDAGIAAELFLQVHQRPIDEHDLAGFGECFFRRLGAALSSQPCREIKGAARLLAELRKGGIAACIATGAWQRSARLKLEAACLDVAHMAFASCDDARNRRDIVRAAIRRAEQLAGVREFDRCVSVGDGVWDVITAAELGIPFIGIGSEHDAKRLRSSGAELVLEDLSDARAFIGAVGRLAP